MQNLASHVDPDPILRAELTRCGIDVVVTEERSKDEVSTCVTGKLGDFTFWRAWYYWVCEGEMPLEAAKRLYAHPVGKTDVRVAGHCMCPPPECPWLQYRDAEGHKLVHDPDGKQERDCRSIAETHPDWEDFHRLLRDDRFVPDAHAAATRVFVDCYHVDSELGLYLLAETIRTLNGRSPP